uniref:3-oxoacyl-ACP synthase n=2 Tax=Gelidibacter sp. TaxID=2018083 RepID=UPI0040490B05
MMMEKNELKQLLFEKCSDYIEARFSTIQSSIEEIQESLSSETKSSAGDKHETGRAMLQLEREKAGQQLAEIENVKNALAQINIEKVSETIILGSLVYTSQYNYFIAISAGLLTIGTETFYAISPQTPIGQLLLGKRVGDRVDFRKQIIVVENVI